MSKPLNTQNSNLTIAIFYLTRQGLNLAERLKALYPDASLLRFRSDIIPSLWKDSDALIFIMATGIVVRTIAPFINNKKIDPAVVVLDEKGKYAISLLSGHLGGANELAKKIAEFLGGEAVITTSSDINNLTPLDIWIKKHELVIENEDKLPQVATRLIDRGFLNVYSEGDMELPSDFIRVSEPHSADVVITNKDLRFMFNDSRLILRPKNLFVGIGCNSGTSEEEIEKALRKVLDDHGFSFLSIHSIATIDRKTEEPGLTEFARKYNFKIIPYTADELNSIIKGEHSKFPLSDSVFKATGAMAVAEPAALLASGSDGLSVRKQKIGNVTIAIAEKKFHKVIEDENKYSKKIYIIGTGPGDAGYIIPKAIEALRVSDVIIGYTTYIELIKDLVKDKEIISTGMTKEIERARMAVDLALSGRTVSVISGGDPGIYGMAGLVLEMIRKHELSLMHKGPKDKNPSLITHNSYLSIEIIPGISALNACAARLGAPLMHDFVCISLSDRLTEWSLIEKRLELAAQGDFVTVLFNPRSKGRPEHINRARDIFLKYRAPETPVGIVKGAMRKNERIVLTDLKHMPVHEIDMETTVIIGNSKTYIWNNWLITPRGYERKYTV
ncbi:MAG: precorrin-3B C(17)-methyltransferase [Thermodesulfovibrionales bacterium]|nr:precorrin-3B C(17)-methyltransferase [Thermodesulfovibrionales bacterium]